MNGMVLLMRAFRKVEKLPLAHPEIPDNADTRAVLAAQEVGK